MPTTTTCEFEHEDMYPEYAPEPVQCFAPATVALTFEDTLSPHPHGTETAYFCLHHAELILKLARLGRTDPLLAVAA